MSLKTTEMERNFVKEYKTPWYLSIGVIALMFSGISLIVPALIGVILIAVRTGKEKAYRKTISSILSDQYVANDILFNRNEILTNANYKSREILDSAQSTRDSIIHEAQSKSEELSKINSQIESQITSNKSKLENLKSELEFLESDLYDKEIFPRESYDDISSSEISNKLSLLKVDQKSLLDDDKGLVFLDGFDSNSKKTLNNNIKQLLRCFNSECSQIISKASPKNIDKSRNDIVKSFEQLNKIFSTDHINLSREFLHSKLTELDLVYSFALKKEQEREIQQAAKQQMIEDERVRKEIEAAKKKIEKEESQFKNEVKKLMSYMQKTESDAEKDLYIDKIRELEEKLSLLEEDKEDVLQREQNTRAGYVYVISNVGSFGEDIFKIGMTRRLEPMDRIKELSSASVPFEFDVHAMIFSEDAPALESELHRAFNEYSLNKVNPRKEFFKVPLDKIEDVVVENHNNTVEFVKTPEAYEYMESMRLTQSY